MTPEKRASTQMGLAALNQRGPFAMLLEDTHVEEHSDFCAACNSWVCGICTDHSCTEDGANGRHSPGNTCKACCSNARSSNCGGSCGSYSESGRRARRQKIKDQHLPRQNQRQLQANHELHCVQNHG